MVAPRQFKTSAAERAAGARKQRRERRLRAYGQWHPWVDAQVVRDHISKQRAGGLGLREISKLSGVSDATISGIVYGRPASGYGPTSRTVREVAERLLSVHATMDNVGDLVRIDSTGTRRRVGAIVAMGHTLAAIANRLGVSRSNFGTTLASPRVRAVTARAVRDLYRDWAFSPPPRDTHLQRHNYSRALTLAKRHGWVSAFAWNDIDDPSETPTVGPRVAAALREPDEIAVLELMAGRPVKAHAVDKREAARRLLADGVGVNVVALRCRMSYRAVAALTEETDHVDDAA